MQQKCLQEVASCSINDGLENPVSLEVSVKGQDFVNIAELGKGDMQQYRKVGELERVPSTALQVISSRRE